MKFIGRRIELESLNSLLGQKRGCLLTIQGRRRIGKSTLVKHFAKIQNIDLYEFSGLAPQPKITNGDQLNHFGKTLAEYLGIKKIELEDWAQALRQLSLLKMKKKTIVLLDEISWLAGKDPNFAGVLKDQWDRNFSQNSNLILILCGSVSSWIQKNILENTGFAGRTSLEIQLKELSPSESLELLGRHHCSVFEIAQILSVTGGVPRYLEEFNLKNSPEENIRKICLNPQGFLFSEFEKLFAEVFGRKTNLYVRILNEVARGPLSPQKIAEQLELPLNGDLIESLNDLELGGFIKRFHTWNFSGKESRLSRIYLTDNYTRFYLKYIRPKKNRLKVKPLASGEALSWLNWTTTFGLQFENMVFNNLGILTDLLKIPSKDIIQVGPFFQTHNNKRKGVQIDVLIQCKGNILHAIEIKSGRLLTADIIEEVKRKNKQMQLPRGFTIRNHLVHLGDLSSSIHESDCFDQIISFDQFLRG